MDTKFARWALVEIMGHKRYAGYVTEIVIAGAGFIQIDVPEVKVRDRVFSAFPKIFGPSAIFGITPRSEEEVRRIAEEICAHAVDPWIFPSQPALRSGRDDDETQEPPFWTPVYNDNGDLEHYGFGRLGETLGRVMIGEDGAYLGVLTDSEGRTTMSPERFDSLEEAQNWVENELDGIPF